MSDPFDKLEKGDALLVIDVQNDFCPGGALPIEHGDLVVDVMNQWIAAARKKGIPIFYSRDWHPRRHPSFVEYGGQWPPHCIQDTEGAAFRSDLILVQNADVISKGVRYDREQYSVFDQTGLAVQLKRDNVARLWVGGLALDVCVMIAVLDAIKLKFDVRVIRDATYPVTPEGGRDALEKMKAAGAIIEGES